MITKDKELKLNTNDVKMKFGTQILSIENLYPKTCLNEINLKVKHIYGSISQITSNI